MTDGRRRKEERGEEDQGWIEQANQNSFLRVQVGFEEFLNNPAPGLNPVNPGRPLSFSLSRHPLHTHHSHDTSPATLYVPFEMLSPVALLVVAGASFVGAQITTTSSSASTFSSSAAVCEVERQLCDQDAACSYCMSGAEPTDFCSQRYPWIFHSGSAGEGPGFDYCEATGASYCCDHETQEISDQCLTHAASIAYWTCVMEDEGCVVDDMPCFASPTLLPSGDPYTPAPVAIQLTAAPAAPTTPETVDFANGAAARIPFGFWRRIIVLVVGLLSIFRSNRV